jgi:hypothetical protein
MESKPRIKDHAEILKARHPVNRLCSEHVLSMYRGTRTAEGADTTLGRVEKKFVFHTPPVDQVDVLLQ